MLRRDGDSEWCTGSSGSKSWDRADAYAPSDVARVQNDPNTRTSSKVNSTLCIHSNIDYLVEDARSCKDSSARRMYVKFAIRYAFLRLIRAQGS